MEILSNIFSIKNRGNTHKIITICGIKISIKLSSKYIMKKYKNKYKKVIQRIKNKKGKIKVVFIVAENQKWAYQGLYELFEKDSKFEPVVLITLLMEVHKGTDKTRNNLDQNYKFFKSRNMNVDFLYENGKYKDLKEFRPDIVFYEQPWELPDMYMPSIVANYALTCYCSYGLPLFELEEDYTNVFHRYLYLNFIDSEYTLNRYTIMDKENKNNCYISNYLKLDAYHSCTEKDVKQIWKNPDKVKIIYAPHHSYDTMLKVATFLENGKFILDLAKKYPQTTWIFKPHPRFNHAMLYNNYMSEDELNQYYEEWNSIGNVYTEGNYFDIFKTSNLMITDCCSFLAEYLPTGNPIIRPVNKDGVKLNVLGENIVKSYYETYNNEELEKVFKDLVVKKNDTKRELRKNIISLIMDKNCSSAKKIYDKILSDIL